MPKYFSLREVANSLSEIIPAKQDHDLIIFDIEKWIAVQWCDGLLKITGRPWTNAGLGDRIEIEPHSDRKIHWHEGKLNEPRIYEKEPGRGDVTAQWRRLEITAEDLVRLKEHIEGGTPESENTFVAPASPVTLAEATASEPETAQPLQPELQKRKPRRAPQAAAMLEWLDQQSEQTRRQTPTFLASQYRKEHPGTATQRYAFKVFKDPERYRGRQ